MRTPHDDERRGDWQPPAGTIELEADPAAYGRLLALMFPSSSLEALGIAGPYVKADE